MQDLQLLQPSIGNTFGALFIGATLAAFLWGISNTQTFLYFQTHRNTGITFFKLVVPFIVHCIYYYLVRNHASMGALTKIVWSFKVISKGRSRALPITMCVIVALASALVWVLYRCHLFSDLVRIEWAVYMALGTVTVVDILIALSMWYFLATSRTGFSNMDSFVNKLMAYTVSTGCITSIGSVATMITCALMPNTFIFLAVGFLVAKLYVNSFLALLNTRYYLECNADNIDSSKTHRTRHLLYRPESRISMPQAEEVQASQGTIPKHLDDEVVFTRPVPTDMSQSPPIAITVEISSFSSP
ncbi:uncharacterized protein EDB93DRAFT_1152494 [Suillus bovinus]|uniref:uncharacterized protein n=1 Tax=Suillus bovinus TaxID=48563 RepID=UPI001B8840E7|nr:uncharacterized protein EDB93DRAFT_1152494 [Suillus bovinus]KAG2144650.1 hypothetical protein EDB93DRAFT_1152494 [Suillus bovinus]